MDNFDKMLFEMAENEPVDAPNRLKQRVWSALRDLPERSRYRACRTARTALCALAAAAVLAGTALAVFSAGGFRSVEFWTGEGLEGEELNWYGLEGGEYRRVPVEELSDKVRTLAEKNPVANTTRYFKDDGWSAAEKFSGVTLPENAAIDALEMNQSWLTVGSNEYGPTALTFWQGTDRLGVTVTAEVYTDLVGEGDITVKRGVSTEMDLTAEEYTAANGLSALVVHLQSGEESPELGEGAEKTERYMADLLVDGFRYHIKVRVNGTEIMTSQEALDTLHAILDGFAI